MSTFNSRGFTLLEMLVVFSVMGILTGGGFASFVSYSKKQVLDQAVQDLKTGIDQAKFNAVSRVKPLECATAIPPKPLSLYRIRICSSTNNPCNPANSTTDLYEIDAGCVEANSSTSFTSILSSKKRPATITVTSECTMQFSVLSGVVAPCTIVLTNGSASKTICVDGGGNTSVLDGSSTCGQAYLPTTPTPTTGAIPTLVPLPTALPIPPSIISESSLKLSSSSEYLSSTVNPNGGMTSITYRYSTSSGTCSSLGGVLAGPTNLTGNTNNSPPATILPGLTGNTVYNYCTTADNTAAGGGLTQGVGGDNNHIDNFLTLPGAPTSVTLSGVTSSNINVSWTAPSGGAASYNLLYCSGISCTPGTGTGGTYIGATSLYSLSGLTCNTSYSYIVRSVNATGTTDSTTVTGTTTGCVTPTPTITPTPTSSPTQPVQVYTSTLAWTTASMVVPSDGIPLFITEKGLYKCTTTACTAFTLVNASYTSGGGSKYSDHQIAIGTDGLPIVVMGANVYKCSNVSCTAGTASTMSVAVNGWSSVAVPADGRPIIGYNAAGVPSAYKCANSSCTSGSGVSIYAGGDPAGSAITVIIAGDGLPVIAFGRDNYGVHVVHCGNAACNSGNTSTLMHSWFTGAAGVAWYTYISIDKGTDGFPILSYINGYSSCSNGLCQPYVYKCSNYQCTLGSEVSLGGTYMLNPSIRVATDGLPVVGINGWNANTQIAKVIKCGNNACSSGNVATAYRTSAQCGYVQSWGSAIGLNSSNIPYYHFTGMCSTGAYTGGFMVKCANTTCN